MSTHTLAPPLVAQQFRSLADEWREATRFDSGPSSDHPAYRAIIALGPDVVPLLLRELADTPDLWFAALRELTGANPVPPEDRGHLRAMAEHWLAWGRDHGLV